MDKRKFDFEEKETYTKQEVEAILGQHTTFIGADKLETEITSLKGELQPFKTKARTKHITSLVSELTDEKRLSAAIKLAGIADEDDDDTVKSKVQSAISENDFLQKPKVDDKSAVKVEDKLPKVEKTETKDASKYANL